jgi:hypothetical protein
LKFHTNTPQISPNTLWAGGAAKGENRVGHSTMAL